MNRRLALPQPWNHSPPCIYLFCSKLLGIPLLSAIGCGTEIDGHKGQPQNHCSVQCHSRRCGTQGQSEVNQALGSVVRADDILEPSGAGEGVLLEACKVDVAFVLLQPTNDEEPNRDRSTWRKMPRLLVQIPRSQDSAFASFVSTTGWVVPRTK